MGVRQCLDARQVIIGKKEAFEVGNPLQDRQAATVEYCVENTSL